MTVSSVRRAMIAGCAAIAVSASAASAQDNGGAGWLSGDYTLRLGVSTFVAPSFEGSDDYAFGAMPMISFGRAGMTTRFSSRNDGISFAILETDTFRVGPAAKIVMPRDDNEDGIRGTGDVDFGVELGAFADWYVTDWLRLRGEVRQAIGAHEGLVADFYADAFYDLSPVLRLSGGPRLSLASEDYFDAYYGVTAAESVASGRAVYDPGGGLKSVGFGGALTWQATDKITTSLFAEYSHLLGEAADSSIVREVGSENQFLIGVSATYRFDFSL